MKYFFVFLFVFVCFVLSANAHMCLISPPQRGPIDGINSPNAEDCNWTDTPCGGTAPQVPYAAFVRGTNFTITWQKNQNHWYSNNPGTFNISWSDASSPLVFHHLYSFVDTNTPALTLYSYILDVDNMIPDESKIGTLQVAYYSPGIPVNFYQCADIIVL